MQKANSRLFFNKQNFLLIFLICLSLSIGYFVGTQSFNKPLYAQEPLTAIATPSINNKTSNKSPSNTPTSPSTLKDDSQDALDLMKEYNKSLLDTIFLSLIGTVVTISLTFFGYQWFSTVLSREQDKEAIQIWVKQELDKEIEKIQQNLWTRTEQQLNSIDLKLKWIEYQIAVLSVEQLEMQNYSQPSFILQEHLRAIRILQHIESIHNGTVRPSLEEELEAINNIIANLASDKSYSNKILIRQVDKIKVINDELRSKYSTVVDKIEGNLHLLTQP